MYLNEEVRPSCHDLDDESQIKIVKGKVKVIKEDRSAYMCKLWRRGKESPIDDFKPVKIPHFKDGNEFKEYLRKRGYID